MKKAAIILASLLACTSLTACGSQTKNNKRSSTTQASTQSNYYFNGTTANIHDVKIHIDKVSYYPAGEGTNDKNLICFDYTITNKTNKDIDAITGWQAVFSAYQDNKNTEGKLEVGALPEDTSEQILNDQMQNIKKGGSVKCRAAYELDSTSKPVVLKATQGVDGKTIGKKTYNISKLKSQSNNASSDDSVSSIQ